MDMLNKSDSTIKMQNIKKKTYIMLLFCIVSIFFLMIFSLGTSFIYDHKYIGKDSDIFLVLGKFAKEGLIPYKDFFDHKGPFIIFVEWLGFSLGNGKPGVFAIQVLFLTATLLGIYKILRLYYREKVSLFVTISSLLILQMYFDRGNLTEEYVLPFLMWSTYYAVKFFKGEEKEHPLRYSFLYGITFTLGAMTRLTNSLPILLLVCVGLVVMIKRELWINILKNIVSFLSGIIVVLFPIIVYFMKVDALEEMLYATFVYNFKHGFERSTLNYIEIIHMVVLGIPLLVALVSGITHILSVRRDNDFQNCKRNHAENSLNNSDIIGVLIAVSSVVAILFLVISRPYPHYQMIWLPVIIVSLGFMKELLYISKKFCYIAMSLCLLIALGKVGTLGMEIYQTLNSHYTQIFEKEADKIVSEIPIEDRKKVIAVNIYAYFYLVTDTTSCYKNFTLQNLHTGLDDREREEFLNDLKSLKAKYIVTESKKGIYSEFIEKNYHLIEHTGMLKLYERKKGLDKK